MPKQASRLKRALKAFADAMEPQGFQVRGKSIVCSVCRHDRFNCDYVALFGIHALICGNCEHVELFRKKPESV